MIRDAIENGVAPDVADAAVRQLFLGAGTWMAGASQTPADTVKSSPTMAEPPPPG
jgi:pyrroline-5-carboxylate reductase